MIYADDITLSLASATDASIEQQLQAVVTTIEQHLKGTGLVCSPAKSELFVFTPLRPGRKRASPRECDHIKIVTASVQHIPEVSKIRVLGLLLNKSGRNDETINKLTTKEARAHIRVDPIPKNVHPQYNQERRQARAKALTEQHAQDPHARNAVRNFAKGRVCVPVAVIMGKLKLQDRGSSIRVKWFPAHGGECASSPNHNETAYSVDPPEFFAPIRLYEKESFEQEYLAAYHEYLTTNDIDDDDVLKNMLANFYATQKRIAEVSEDPRRRVHDPFKQTDNNAFFKPVFDVVTTKAKEERGFALVAGHQEWLDQDLADYVALWVLQFASLGGVKASPLARIHYRYAALLNEPPSAERRCLDLMEPMMRDYMLATLRITHVFENEDVHETAKEKAQTAMKALVNHVKQFLAKSALAADDLSEAFSLLDKVKFEVFFPGDLSAREVDFIIPGLSTSAGIVVGIEAYTQGMLKSADAILNGLTGWPISTFAHEPLYIASLETMYVPYAVFAWAYMGSNSSLPFSIPVYGLKIVRELFKVFDYRSNWWVAKNGPTAAAYGDLESCVERLEALYRITDPVERYETIAEIAAVHVLYDMYVTWVQERKNDAVDVRVPFLKTVHSTTQFFVALASDMCARTNVTIRDELNTFHGVKTAEQRLEVLANHMPQFSAHFECKSSARMYTKKNYENCLFWKP
ncbi:uncharacterized protein LOC144139760 [Haemaphysalis longicornis]